MSCVPALILMRKWSELETGASGTDVTGFVGFAMAGNAPSLGNQRSHSI